MYAFIHIPKTAGSTLRSILRKTFGARHCDIRVPAHARADHEWIRASDLRLARRIYPRLAGFAGHRVTSFQGLEQEAPGLRYFTILREPRARFIANFRHQYRSRPEQGTREDFCRYCEDPRQRNLQTRWLCGSESAPAAMSALDQKIGFVGLTEDFDASLLMLGRWLGIEESRLAYQSKNQKCAKREHDTLDDAEARELVESANRQDIETYRYVVEVVMPRQRAAYGPTLADDVARFAELTRRRPRFANRFGQWPSAICCTRHSCTCAWVEWQDAGWACIKILVDSGGDLAESGMKVWKYACRNEGVAIMKAYVARHGGWVRSIVALAVVMAVCCARADDVQPLRVGIATDYPPVVYKQGNDIFGFEADNARGAAEALGRPLQYVEMPFGQLIPSLQENKIDVVMSGMTVTEERAKLVSFCKPYVVVNMSALVRKADKQKFPDAAALRKAKIVIGVGEGTTGSEYARVYCWGKKATVFLSSDEVAAALAAGKIDVYLRDTPVVQWVQSANTDTLAVLDFGLVPQSLGWAVNQSNKDLRKKLDKLVKTWTKSGRLKATTARWLPNYDPSSAAVAGLQSALFVNVQKPDASQTLTAEFQIDGKKAGEAELAAPKWNVFYLEPGDHTFEATAGNLHTDKQPITMEVGKNFWQELKLHE